MRFRSKSALKLAELDDRFSIFSRAVAAGKTSSPPFHIGVVDLCAAPGGFSQVAIRKLLALDTTDPIIARCLAVDLQEIAPFSDDADGAGRIVTLRADVQKSHNFIVNKILQTFRVGAPTGAIVLPTVFLHDGVCLSDAHWSQSEKKTAVPERDLSVIFRQNVIALAALKIALSTLCHLQALAESVPEADDDELTAMERRMGVALNAAATRRVPFVASSAVFVTKFHASDHFESTVLPLLSRCFERVSPLVRLNTSPAPSLERYVVARGFKFEAFRVPQTASQGKYKVRRSLLALHPTPTDMGARGAGVDAPFYFCVGCGQDVNTRCETCRQKKL